MIEQLDTPATDTPVKPLPDFWEVVTDILDNPFIKPCERDGALLEMGYKVMLSDVITV